MFDNREVVMQWRKKKRKKGTPEDTTIELTEDQVSEELMKLLPKILVGGVVAVFSYKILSTACEIAVLQYKD
jgi:hypothetical protein